MTLDEFEIGVRVLYTPPDSSIEEWGDWGRITGLCDPTDDVPQPSAWVAWDAGLQTLHAPLAHLTLSTDPIGSQPLVIESIRFLGKYGYTVIPPVYEES